MTKPKKPAAAKLPKLVKSIYPDWTEEIVEKVSKLLLVAEALGMRKAAKMVENVGWKLPLLATAELNEATDDAAVMVQKQITAALRARADRIERGEDA